MTQILFWIVLLGINVLSLIGNLERGNKVLTVWTVISGAAILLSAFCLLVSIVICF